MPNPGSESASPMHARDRRLYVILAWSAIPATLVAGCFIAWGGGQLPASWALAGIVIGLLGMAAATIYALEKKPPSPRYPGPMILGIAALTWALIGWQTWMFFHSPSQTSQAARNGSFGETYIFTAADARKIRDEVFKIRDSLPPLMTVQTGYDSEAKNVAFGLYGGISNAGVRMNPVSQTNPLTPQETGISIRVSDLSKIPNGARLLGEAIQKALGVEPTYTAMRDLQSDQFILFVGTNPNEH